jgi:membrane protein involved in colicin uptake
VRSTSSTDLDSTDPVSTPSRDQQATASPCRKRRILVFSGTVIIAIAASGAYAFTAHSTAAAVKNVQAQLVDAENDFTTAHESVQSSIALADEYGLSSDNVTALKAIYADSEATVTALAEAPNNAKASNEKIELLKKVLDQAKTSTNKLNAALAPIAGELDDLTVKKLDEAVNKADQAVNDAKNLMGETDGKVKDNATRDGLQSTIDDTAKTLDEAREAVKNRSHLGDDRKWNVDEEKKLTDAVNALSEKSNQVRDSRGQWEAEQASAASSSVGASRSTGVSSAHSRSNGGGSASQSSGSTGGSQGGSTGQSYWTYTEESDPSLGYNCTLKTNGSTTCHDNSGNQIYKDGQWSNGNQNGRWSEGGR